jgi:inactive phospholipase C-like protein 2
VLRWLGSVFDEADSDGKGSVSEKSAVRLIMSMNNRLLLTRIKHKVKEVSSVGNDDRLRGRVTREQFIELYKDLATRPELYFL